VGGDYAVFAQCPLTEEVVGCLAGRTVSGEFTVGNRSVPIVRPLTLQGGVGEESAVTGAQPFIGAANGETLPRAPQMVPGGLSGLVGCNEINGRGWFARGARRVCEAVFRHGFSSVSATPELAAPASAIGLNLLYLFAGFGTALSLPVKIRLENPLLGRDCYIGSDSDPVTLNLTSGITSPPEPNKPIQGKPGTGITRAEGRVLVISSTLVDNAFSEPAATGCGGVFAALIDPLVNAKLGLPSPAGRNTAIFTGTHELAGINAVLESGEAAPTPTRHPHRPWRPWHWRR
jgi:hypothetical protein